MSDIKGLKKVLKDLSKFGKEAETETDIALSSNASEIAVNARIKAPKDTGKLQQSISFNKKEKLTYTISASVPYAPYMEYGTGGLVDVPEELKDNAIQFKGSGIKKINLRPRPFLYPSFVKGRVKVIKDLTDSLNDLTKKYG